jgi:hypothetical protein
MIQENELRIGNWVFMDNRRYHKWADVDYTCNPDDFSPIPLTPELLEKCGFEYSEGWYHRKISGLNLNILPNSDYHIDGEQIAPLKSLHQLQNLYFSLTNEELQIQL